MDFEDITSLLSGYWDWFLLGALSTVILSVIGTLAGLFFGIFLALGSSLHVEPDSAWINKAWRYLVKGFCAVYSTVIRGTPMMVQAMIFKYGCLAFGLNWNAIAQGIQVFDGWFYAGLIVITFNTAAYMGEIVKAGLNGVDPGQIEGARSLGLSRFKAMRYVALPQAIRNAIPTIGNEWVVNIKDSSVLNVIGVTELYFMSGQAANKNYKFVAAYVIVAVIYLCLTLLANMILHLSKCKMDGKPVFGFRHAKVMKGA